MSNIIPFPGGAHERPTKLSNEQREAIIGRWPVRFTTGQPRADRALWAMYRVSVSETAVSTPEKEHSLGSNVVRLETERQQLEITQAGARPDLQGTGTDSQAYDLDAIRSAVHASYPIENRRSYDQKAA